ncbi:uncharacterized protein DAT39_002386, partial [Clarias magur]
MSFVWLPLSAGEDTSELHAVDLEMETLEKQIRGLQVKLAQLRQRKAAMESPVPGSSINVQSISEITPFCWPQIQRRISCYPGKFRQRNAC